MTVLRSILAVTFGALCLSESAMALSCMRPDLAQTMEKAKQSEKLYYILVGNLTSDVPIKQEKPDYENQHVQKPPQITRVRFTGYSLAQSRAWDVPLSGFPMDVETRCFGPWCSGVPTSGDTQIFFVEANTGGAPILRVSPCPEMVFYQGPKDDKVDKLRTCFDKECISDQPGYR